MCFTSSNLEGKKTNTNKQTAKLINTIKDRKTKFLLNDY